MRVYWLLISCMMLIFSNYLSAQNKLLINTGIYNVLDKTSFAMGSIEYRHINSVQLINPFCGILLNSKGDVFFYLGVYHDITIYGDLVFNLQFAPGFYYGYKNNSLGDIVEFNSGFEFSYKVNDSSIGLSFHHISNGGLSKYNPGAEILFFSYGVNIK